MRKPLLFPLLLLLPLSLVLVVVSFGLTRARPADGHVSVAAPWQDDGPVAFTGRATGAVEGQVVDANGSPVAGADIVLARASGDDAAPAAISTARSGAGGRFSLEAVAPGSYAATALSQQGAPALLAPVEVYANRRTRVRLQLGEAPLSLAGRVTDVGGGAVVGARLTVNLRGTGGWRTPFLFVTTTDGEGRYRLPLDRGQHVVGVAAAGYASATTTLVMARPTTLDVALVPGARVSGQVFDIGAEPAAGADVEIAGNAGQPRQIRADLWGRFEVDGLAPGVYTITARTAGRVGAGQVTLAVAEVRSDLMLQLERAYVIAGELKDRADRPLAGARVELLAADAPAAQARTDAGGAFTFAGLFPGDYQLRVRETGYAPLVTEVSLDERDARGLLLTVQPAARVAGRVLGPGGHPAAGAHVVLELRSEGPLGHARAAVVTGRDGSFLFDELPAGRFTLLARQGELGSGLVGPERLTRGEERRVEVVLDKGGSVAGRLWLQNPQAAEASARLPTPILTGRVAVHEPPARDLVPTFIDGSTAAGEGAGEGALVPHAGVERPLEPGASPDDEELLPEPRSMIEGVVIGPGGTPLPGVVLTAQAEGGELGGPRDARGQRAATARAVSDWQGRFTLARLARGQYTVTASHPHHPDVQLPGVNAGGRLELRFVEQGFVDQGFGGKRFEGEGRDPVGGFTLRFPLGEDLLMVSPAPGGPGILPPRLLGWFGRPAFEDLRLAPAP